MMGYTHAAIGAAGGLAAAIVLSEGDATSALYVTAAVAGIIGGIAVDADVIDQRKGKVVTDGSRSRLAAIGILMVGLLLDMGFKMGIISNIISASKNVWIGLVGFIILFLIAHLIGRIVGHRTFSHSVWFILLTTVCIALIYPAAGGYYFLGAILHLLFDLLNYQAPNKNGKWHGVWLLYPIKRGDGIALKKCKASGKGNKTLYFTAIILYMVLTIYYVLLMGNIKQAVAPIILSIVTVIILHFVRRKSEQELLPKNERFIETNIR